MTKGIYLSGYKVRAFYTDRGDKTCNGLGTFYKCRINKRDKEPADGECALCKRLDAFRRQREEEEG